MPALSQAEATRLVDASLGKVAYVAPTTPMMLALTTTIGTASVAGTEVANAGGSTYARQSLTAATPAGSTNGVITSNAVIAFTNMPDTTAASVKAVEVFDSAGTPRRAWWGQLTTARTTALGDTLSFASGALSLQAS